MELVAESVAARLTGAVPRWNGPAGRGESMEARLNLFAQPVAAQFLKYVATAGKAGS
ncbi:hypothetical protein GCM10023323_24390 [Streptomyces thinghirensis]|uniref:Uncharacterized protein n=1 Tax=Streptomyces thinghirensis TaxID=551547 RepID=A0ABP9T485_9ACTN